MNSQSSSAAAGRRHTGPNLGMVATVYVLPKIASVVPVSAFGSKPPFFPGLNAPTEAVVSYFSTHAHAVLICAFLQLGAAIPFGIFAATVASRLHFLGVNAAGASIAFFGGAMAAINELNSGARDLRDGEIPGCSERRAGTGLSLPCRCFGRPGVHHAIWTFDGRRLRHSGLLKLLPKWLLAFGLLLALTGGLSWLSIVIPQAGF
jgi:hypothetical protein